ncbi:MAG: shikimate dehydrogenase [Myxococcota bacterium]|nr:shikimate dehydrogenase [Myxococcota bacterium]
MISGHTRVFGLLGHPVRHSLSPEMHTTLFQELGLDAVYVAFDVDPGRAHQVGQAIRTLDLVGVNLTVPFKTAILPQLDHVTQAALEAGAVNVVTQIDGELTGTNTDGIGLVRALVEEHGFQARGSRCTLLGAGGAARAVAAHLASEGAASVTLCNRTRSRAEQACEHLRSFHPSVRFVAAPLSALEPSELVVNCLGGGAESTVQALDLSPLPNHAIWCDINYWMDQPPKLAECAARGLRTSDGLGMLIHQGALSFELFTGHPVDPARIRAFLSKGAAARV